MTKNKMHYLSCHSVLEYTEVKLFNELGIDIFSNGAYADPKGHKLLPRPGIEGLTYYPEYEKLAREHPKTSLSPELIDPFDTIMIMHEPAWIVENWDKIKHKKVIWRSIGQSTKHVENMLRKMRYEGLKIVRMSPMEEKIPDYIGADAIIPFYQDPEEWKDWVGENKKVINFTQSLLGRRVFCHYDQIMKIIDGFPAVIYGEGNDDLGALNGGNLPYDLMKGALRDNRVFLYAGTWPSPYTLAFQEAWMCGIPVVAIGKNLAEDLPEIPSSDRLQYYELPNFIESGVNGFIADDIGQLRAWTHALLSDDGLARKISQGGRAKAIELFGKEKIKLEWEKFFKEL